MLKISYITQKNFQGTAEQHSLETTDVGVQLKITFPHQSKSLQTSIIEKENPESSLWYILLFDLQVEAPFERN